MLLLTNYLIILVVESVLFAILIYLFYNLFNFIYLCKPFFGNKTENKEIITKNLTSSYIEFCLPK